MKEWNKPFMKVVVLDECDMIATSTQTDQSITADDAGYVNLSDDSDPIFGRH